MVSAVEVNCFQQRRQLARRQISPVTNCDPGNPQGPDPDASQTLDGDPGCFHHVANDVIRSFMDHHLQDQTVVGFAENPKLFGDDSVSVNDDTRPNPLQHLIRGSREGQNVILLFHLVPWMHDAVRDVTVVGEKQ